MSDVRVPREAIANLLDHYLHCYDGVHDELASTVRDALAAAPQAADDARAEIAAKAISLAVAKNASVAPELVYAPVLWGLRDFADPLQTRVEELTRGLEVSESFCDGYKASVEHLETACDRWANQAGAAEAKVEELTRERDMLWQSSRLLADAQERDEARADAATAQIATLREAVIEVNELVVHWYNSRAIDGQSGGQALTVLAAALAATEPAPDVTRGERDAS